MYKIQDWSVLISKLLKGAIINDAKTQQSYKSSGHKNIGFYISFSVVYIVSNV